MLVKICGITRVEDAEAAIACGAAALGFVFWPKSPRFVDPYRARAIVASLPPFVTTVGVFVNQPALYVNGVASLVGLSAVQLHGDETVEFARQIRRPVLKVVALGDAAGDSDGDLASAFQTWPSRFTPLLDVRDLDRRGGTGRTIDWTRAARLAAMRPVVLAGGLTPDNVGTAIATVRPFCIDVSSGVEMRPGVKDHRRLKALFDVVTARTTDGDARGAVRSANALPPAR